jgi:starch phosphorylase
MGMSPSPDGTNAALSCPVYRTGVDIETLKRAFLDNLFFVQGKPVALATQHDYYMALACMVRDRMLHRWNGTAESYTRDRARTVCYLSAEFLMGPHLGNNLINMGIYDQVKQAIEELGLDFEELLAQEVEPGSATAAWAISGLLSGLHGLPGNSLPGLWDSLRIWHF